MICCFTNIIGIFFLKITKILILGVHLKSNNLIVLDFKKGSESK
jgi:hypothetical protein